MVSFKTQEYQPRRHVSQIQQIERETVCVCVCVCVGMCLVRVVMIVVRLVLLGQAQDATAS
jgi:hypothetical protein